MVPIDIMRDNAIGRPAGNVGVSKLSGYFNNIPPEYLLKLGLVNHDACAWA